MKNNKLAAIFIGTLVSACLTIIILFLTYNTSIPIFEASRFSQIILLWLMLYTVSLLTELFDSRDVQQLITNLIFSTVICIITYVLKQNIAKDNDMNKNFLILFIPCICETLISAIYGKSTKNYIFTSSKSNVDRKFSAATLGIVISLTCTCTILYGAYHSKLPIFQDSKFFSGVYLLTYLIIISTLVELFDSSDIEQVLINNLFAFAICLFICITKLTINENCTDNENFKKLFIPGMLVALISAFCGKTVKTYLVKNKTKE